MSFWDSSALVPIAVEEQWSSAVTKLAAPGQRQTVWWGTMVECLSALVHRVRSGDLDPAEMTRARTILDQMARRGYVVRPTDEVRRMAERLVLAHGLRAGDALQLAAGLDWASGERGLPFVTLDEDLRDAARLEGFDVLP